MTGQVEIARYSSLEDILSGHPQFSKLTRSDDAEIRTFFNQVAMRGQALSLFMRRDPRFFDFYDQRGGESLTLGLRDYSGKLVGQGSVVSTPCFINRQRGHFGYLCDLRVDCPDRSLRQEWKEVFSRFLSLGPNLKELGENGRLVTVILDNNERARRLIEDRVFNGHRFVPLTRYSMVNVIGRWPWRGRPRGIGPAQLSVTRGGTLEEIETFLAKVHREQAFGINYGAPDFVLRRNLKMWSNFSLDDFFVVRNANQEIVAATALWKTSHCKQTIVTGPGWAGAFNRAIKWLGLPEFGQPIEFLYLTHLTFDWQLTPELKAAAFSLLIEALWPETKRRGAHALSFCNFKDYSLLPALPGYMKFETHLKMYMALPEKDIATFTHDQLGRFPPAFEMALA